MNTEQQADEILKEWAKHEHQSLRKLGIIDGRRDRTIRSKEIPFADFFANRKARHDAGT